MAEANKDKSGKTGMGNFKFPKKKIDTDSVDQRAEAIEAPKVKTKKTKPTSPKARKDVKNTVEVETQKMTIVIPKSLHQKLKSHCALNGMKIREYVIQLIDGDLN